MDQSVIRYTPENSPRGQEKHTQEGSTERGQGSVSETAIQIKVPPSHWDKQIKWSSAFTRKLKTDGLKKAHTQRGTETNQSAHLSSKHKQWKPPIFSNKNAFSDWSGAAAKGQESYPSSFCRGRARVYPAVRPSYTWSCRSKWKQSTRPRMHPATTCLAVTFKI